MSSVNKVILIGNLGCDPEVRTTQGGQKIVNLSIATSESWKDKQTGEKRERTEWHRVVIFNDGLAGVAERYIKKGSKVYLEGQLQTRKWTDKDGTEKYTTEVVLQKYRGELVLLGDKPAGQAAQQQSGPNNYQRAKDGDYDPHAASRAAQAPLDDDIPF